MELGLGFCVDGGPRLPWRFARALVLVGLGHGPVLLRRLPVGDRVDEATSKQASSTASALVSSACYLTVVSWLTYPSVYIIKIAKDTVSASDVVGYGVVLHMMTSSRDMWLRVMLYFFSRPADCGMQVYGMYVQEKADCLMRSMRLTPQQSVDDSFESMKQLTEVTFRSVKSAVVDTVERVLPLRIESLHC